MTTEIKDLSPGARSAGAAAAAAPVPALKMVWINGNLTDEKTARVSPFDHGLLVGDGAFETLGAYGGKIYAMRRHYERLRKGCGVLGIDDLPSQEVLREACEAVVRANGLNAAARVRVTVTGGPGPLGSEKGDEGATVVVAAAAMPAWDAAAAVVTVPWTRNENGALAGLKTTSYGENVLALAYAKKRGASEAIFGNTQGRLCEGTGSNIFVVRDGRVITPPLSSGCLAGVTRGLVLELCAGAGIPATEADMTMKEFGEVEEAFLTSTTREVQPIGSVDGRVLPRAPGDVTARLKEALRGWMEREMDP